MKLKLNTLQEQWNELSVLDSFLDAKRKVSKSVKKALLINDFLRNSHSEILCSRQAVVIDYFNALKRIPTKQFRNTLRNKTKAQLFCGDLTVNKEVKLNQILKSLNKVDEAIIGRDSRMYTLAVLSLCHLTGQNV